MQSQFAHRRPLERQIFLKGVGALAALFLGAGGARADSAWSRTFEAGIPLLGAAPQIDGQVNEAEWGQAARLPPLLSGDADGFADELEANEIFIGYTAEALHIAWRVRREGEFLLRHLEPGYREGRAVWADDHIELFLDVGRADRRSITFVGNAAGAYGDGTIPFTGSGTDFAPTWPWSYAARRTADGWEAELSLPFAAVNLAAPEPGDTIRADFWRNIRSDRSYWTQLALSNRNRNRFAQLTFLGATPVARIQAIAPLDDQTLGLNVELVNPLETAQTVEIAYGIYRRQDRISRFNFLEAYDSGLDETPGDAHTVATFTTPEAQLESLLSQFEPLVQETRTVPLAPGATVPVTLAARPSPVGDYLVAYRAVDAAGRVLMSGMTPTVRWEPVHVETTPYFLRAEQLDTRVALRSRELRATGRSVRAALSQRGEIVAEDTADTARAAAGLGLSTARIVPGDYVLDVQVFDAGQQNIAARTIKLYRPEPPAWTTQTHGLTRFVPRPWTPVEAAPQAAEVWGRSYRFAESFLPAQVISQGEPVFSAPPRLLLQVDGEPRTLTGELTLRETDPEYALWSWTGHAGPVSVQATTRLEFDGFMLIDLHLETQGATIEQLWVEFPLNAAQAQNYRMGQYYNQVFGASARALSHGLPGSGKLPDAFQIGFNHGFWIGSDQCGFEWTAETAENWRNEDRGRAIELERSPETALLRLRVIDRPAQGSSWHYRWGLAFTPVRAYAGGSDGIYFTQSGGGGLDVDNEEQVEALRERLRAKQAAGVEWLNIFSQWNRDFAFGQPFRERDDLERYRNRAAITQAHGINPLFYTGWNGLHPNMEMWPYYGAAMRTEPYRTSYGGYSECTYGGYIEYLSAGVEWLYRNFGSKGVYLDGTGPKFCRNPYHGCGFDDPDTGARIATLDIFGRRELFKRLYKITHGEVMDEGLIYSHAGGYLAMEAFVSVRHTGEGGGWEYYAQPESYRASNDPAQFGIPIEHAWRQHHPVPRNLAWGMALVHDNRLKMYPGHYNPRHPHMRAHYADNGGIDHRMWVPLKWFDWTQAHTWHPYYRNAAVLAGGGEDIYASFRVNAGGQIIFNVLNLNPQEQEVSFRLNTAALGLPDRLHARDAVTHETFEIANGEFRLQILGHRPRVLMIAPEPVPHIVTVSE